jgi:hypothetical protein
VVVVGGLASAAKRDGVPTHREENAQSQEAQPTADRFERSVLPILQTACFDCHSGVEPAAGLDLTALASADEVVAEPDRLRKMLRRIASGDMPPPDGPELAAEDRATLVAYFQPTFLALGDGEIRSGPPVTRRLSRVEYANSIRDLVGVDYAVAEAFPADDVGYGLDNIGDVLSISPLLVEKYLDAADEIARRAIVDPDAMRTDVSLAASEFALDNGHQSADGELVLTTTSMATTSIELRAAGRYRIEISAYGHQAGPESVKMSCVIDGRPIGSDEVTSRRSPSRHEFEFRHAGGHCQIGVSFDNDYYRPEAPKRSDRDRNLVLSSVRVVGPLDIDWATSASSGVLHVVVPSETVEPRAAAAQTLAPLLPRAYRRPVAEAELEELLDLVDEALREGESYHGALQVALSAILSSPHFLLKVESQAPTDGRAAPLDDWELASALSFLLWSSGPDDELLELAAAGRLQDPAELRRQVTRMLDDPRGAALVENFATQWLQLRLLDRVDPDPQLVEDFRGQLADSMRRETQLFVADLVKRNDSLLRLLDGDYTYVDAALARHYGLPDSEWPSDDGQEFQRISLDGTPRRGILTHASILTITSNPNRTSPVKRGKWVLETLLAEPPPPPLPDVISLESQSELTGSLREKMEQHRRDPRCATCHAKMDALGFAMEHFDAVGRFRNADGDHPIDARAQLPSGETFEGVEQLEQLLLRSRGDQIARAFAERLLTFGLGRGLAWYDHVAIERAIAESAADGYRVRDIIESVVLGSSFRCRQSASQ